jgi:hypothetical protein
MTTPRDRTAAGRFRILAVANETVEGDALHDLILARAAGRPTDVVVVAPALNTRFRHWCSDDDRARRAAEQRLARTLERLAAARIVAHGWTGDAEPLTAIADALAVFQADELVISTHPEEQSNWLARDVVRQARDRFRLPTAHVVVDGARTELLAAA